MAERRPWSVETRSYIEDKRVFDLIAKYGSPLYLYDELTLRERCREVRSLLPANFRVNYSTKANSNLEILKIIASEDLDVDAMSPGEILLELAAGFSPERIFYIGNNVSAEEMRYAIERNIVTSVDSLSQLDLFGKVNPGGDVAIRFNPGAGAGHHQKVITAGKATKFAVQRDFIPEVRELLKQHKLRLIGINQHLGSGFLNEDVYVEGAKNLLEIASEFQNLQFIDLGGGFGVPYKPGEKRLDIPLLSEKLSAVIEQFRSGYSNKGITIKAEPGRYLVAECGLLLGEIYSIKKNYGTTYVGTDLGFNVLARPVMYDAFHDVRLISRRGVAASPEAVTIVGNICETGDIIAQGREVPEAREGDIVLVTNAGAYGYSMASNYNCRLRPAEVLLGLDGSDRLIRKRDTLESLLSGFEV